MDTATLPEEHLDAPRLAGEARPASGRPTRHTARPVVVMVIGVVVLALAATALAGELRRRQGPGPAPAPVPADPMAITLAMRDVSVVSQVYGPGEESGWHAHAGIHAVAVLSGALTVYDGQCRAETYGPGRPYVGGQDIHLVRNASTEPVVMAVTYLSPSVGAAPTRRLPAPPGCVVGEG